MSDADFIGDGDGQVRVMHPIDVLDSRIQNLHVLASKRNAHGVAQAQLAVAMVRAFLSHEIATHGERVESPGLEGGVPGHLVPGTVRIA